MSLGSIPASIVTLIWMDLTRRGQTSHGTIVHALGAVLLVTAIAMLARRKIQSLAVHLRTETAEAFKAAQPLLTVLAGVVLGVVVPLTSVGAGALGTVMLLYLYPLRMTPTRLAGTDIVHAIPLAVIAGTGHLLMGNVEMTLLINLLLGLILVVVSIKLLLS
jgi:uncharacterized membrane protein YfcA